MRSRKRVVNGSKEVVEGSRNRPCVLWGNGDGVGRVRVAEKRREESKEWENGDADSDDVHTTRLTELGDIGKEVAFLQFLAPDVRKILGHGGGGRRRRRGRRRSSRIREPSAWLTRVFPASRRKFFVSFLLFLFFFSFWLFFFFLVSIHLGFRDRARSRIWWEKSKFRKLNVRLCEVCGARRWKSWGSWSTRRRIGGSREPNDLESVSEENGRSSWNCNSAMCHSLCLGRHLSERWGSLQLKDPHSHGALGRSRFHKLLAVNVSKRKETIAYWAIYQSSLIDFGCQ